MLSLAHVDVVLLAKLDNLVQGLVGPVCVVTDELDGCLFVFFRVVLVL